MSSFKTTEREIRLRCLPGYSLGQYPTTGSWPSGYYVLTDPNGVEWSYDGLWLCVSHAKTGKPQAQDPNEAKNNWEQEQSKRYGWIDKLCHQCKLEVLHHFEERGQTNERV